MALGNFFKRQLRTVIEWTNQQPNVLFYEFPTPTNEIKNASKLIVNPGQGCILVYKGEVIDVLTKSGSYELSTSNHPFITNLIKILQSFESEHKMHVYFFRLASLVDQKWGTSTPIKYVDRVYQFPIELGAYGTYAIKIEQAELFFKEIMGTKSVYTANDLSQLMISRIIPTITSQLATESYSYLNIDSQLMTLSQQIKDNLQVPFTKLGLVLDDFQVEATTFSQETLERISKIADSRTDALAAKEVGLNYVEHEKLKALRDVARNEGGLAGAGLQIGAGLAIAKTFDLNQANNDNTTSTIDSNAEIIKQLKLLKELLDEGILTKDEFIAKKAQLLEKL